MGKTFLKFSSIAAGLAACGAITSAQAQSVDGLLKKLVDKGVISKQEAEELRKEEEKTATKNVFGKTALPDWVTSFKIYGDLRLRGEGFYAEDSDFVDRTRFRYRMRLGATAVMKDNLEFGFRLTTAENNADNATFGGDPISSNSTFQNNGSKKFIFVDLAYGKWTFLNDLATTGNLIVGKMENPFILSDLVFDADYTPEGIGSQWAYKVHENHSVKFNAGAFLLDEVGSSGRDPIMGGVQLRWDAAWTPKIATSIGVAGLGIMNEEFLGNSNVPNIQRGNTRETTPEAGAGNPAPRYNFNPIVGDVSLTYTLDTFPGYKGKFPMKFGGEFMQNPAAPRKNNAFAAGFTLGKSGRKGLWDLTYRYKYLEADAWYEEFADSDFGAFYHAAALGGSSGYQAGTNLKGHVVRLAYSPFDALTLGLTWYATRLIDETPTPAGTSPVTPLGHGSDMHRIQLDASLKF